MGAKRKEDKGGKPVIEDMTGLILWNSDIRGMISFDSTEDIDVLPGNEVDEVIVKLIIQPVDSMEKMYMTVMVGQKTSGYTVSSIAA